MISQQRLAGTWRYRAPKAPFGFRKGKVIFSQQHGTFQARLKIHGLGISTRELTFDTTSLSFVAGVESEQLLIALSVKGNKLNGLVHFSEGTIPIELEKSGAVGGALHGSEHGAVRGAESDAENEEAAQAETAPSRISPALLRRRRAGKALSRKAGAESKAHIFYYCWYGNPEHDQGYHGWGHSIIPHKVKTQWNHLPPYTGGDDIASNFYPELGSYSSRDPQVIERHMQQISAAGIGVVVLSWWGGNSFSDKPVADILDAAHRHRLKVAFHLEPGYSSVAEFRAWLNYLREHYLQHPALYRLGGLPVYYLYNSFKLEPEEWQSLLMPQSPLTLRDTPLDGLFINLLTTRFDGEFTLSAGFDGFYTYYASDGFAWGCTTDNWPSLADFARRHHLIWIPCAGPGYIDTRVRPWNEENSKARDNGRYYDAMMQKAADSNPDFIGITSFNEWFEGTQIEPAVAKAIPGYTYEDYGQQADPRCYLHQTRALLEKHFSVAQPAEVSGEA